MYTVSDLKFEKVDSPNAPHLPCNNCGKTKPVHGGYIAEIQFAQDADHSFFLCSSVCVVEFHEFDRREIVNGYINDCLNRSITLYYSKH